MPRPLSSLTLAWVGFVLCSPVAFGWGTRETWTEQKFSLPTRNWNCRKASTKGIPSMSPIVPPSSMMHSYRNKWMEVIQLNISRILIYIIWDRLVLISNLFIYLWLWHVWTDRNFCHTFNPWLNCICYMGYNLKWYCELIVRQRLCRKWIKFDVIFLSALNKVPEQFFPNSRLSVLCW